MQSQTTIKGFAILSSAVLIVKILSLLYIPFLRNILGGEGWGLYMASYQIFVLIYAITNSGIPQAISKIVSELIAVGNYKDAVKAFKMARVTLITAGIIMSLILLVSAGILTKLAHYQKAYLAVTLLAPTIVFSTITSSYRGYFQGRGNMTPTAVSQVLEQVVNMFFTLLLSFLFLKYGIEIAVAGGAFATTIAAIFASVFLITIYRKNKESKIIRLQEPSIERYTNKQLFKRIINYSLPLIAYQALFYIGNLIDLGNTKMRLLHAGFSDSISTSLFGDLSIFNQLIGVPNAIIASLSIAILPSIASSVAINDSRNVKDKINSAFKICFIISIPSAIALSVLSYPVYRLMHYGDGAYIMLYGAYVLILISCVQVFSSILQGLGKLYIVTFFLVFGVAGKIITNYFLIAIPTINIMGAIFGNVVYYTVPLILDNIILIKILKIKINVFTHAFKPFIASLIMGVVLFISYNGMLYILMFVSNNYISNAIASITSMFIGAYTYFFIMALIKGITKDDMDMLPSKLEHIIPRSILKVIKY